MAKPMNRTLMKCLAQCAVRFLKQWVRLKSLRFRVVPGFEDSAVIGVGCIGVTDEGLMFKVQGLGFMQFCV